MVEKGVIVVPPDAMPEQRKLAEQCKLKDLKAKNYLFQAIDRMILKTTINRDTIKNTWDSMRRKYQGSMKVKRAQL